MTLFSRESVLENMFDEEGVASGDESMDCVPLRLVFLSKQK